MTLSPLNAGLFKPLCRRASDAPMVPNKRALTAYFCVTLLIHALLLAVGEE
jgi:hypothetical protein